MLKECIRASASAIDDLVAGTSIEPGCLSSLGIDNEWLNFVGELEDPLLAIFCKLFAATPDDNGLWALMAKSLSLNEGAMLKVFD
jgi:hypothetical protein